MTINTQKEVKMSIISLIFVIVWGN